MKAATPLLQVQDLSVSFVQYFSLRKSVEVLGLRQVNLQAYPGQIHALVGASGAGKSLLAHAILGLLPGNAQVNGQILFEGKKLLSPKSYSKNAAQDQSLKQNSVYDKKFLGSLRGGVLRLIPQSVSYLDPSMKVGSFLRSGRTKASSFEPRESTRAKQDKQEVLRLLTQMGLDESVYNMYPHQLSGGMARRVLLATAFMFEPAARLVVADEPTPGLHPEALESVHAHFLRLRSAGACVLLITHDLMGALEIADCVSVFHNGTIVDSFSLKNQEHKALEDLNRVDNLNRVDSTMRGLLPKGVSEYTAKLFAATPGQDFWEAL